MPSVYFETFGCQMNVADSSMLGQALFAKGYYPSQTSADADLLVVNTCSVRERAEVRAKARIREYISHRKQANGTQEIWVIGCMAQRLGEALKQELPGVDRVIGAQDIVSFVQDIDGFLPARTTASTSQANPLGVFVPIMRGCDNYCTYCIVPLVRGPESSIAADDLVQSVKQLAASGVKEVTLLGQNVNSYHDATTDFAGLLEKIQSISGIVRVRFTTSHPKDCTDGLLQSMARYPKLCKHVHLPVQSGSNRILDLMHRRYTRESYLGRIEAIRRLMPDADITTDAMVGFPSESESDFNDTLSLFKEVRFTAAFMFAYSRREGTAAAEMADDVPPAIKKERLSKLISLQTDITKEQYAAMVGKALEVLFVEQQRGGERLWIGQDGGCKRAVLACKENIAGMILKVRVVRSSGMTLITERI